MSAYGSGRAQSGVAANNFMGNAGSKRNTKVAVDNNPQTSVTTLGSPAIATSTALNAKIDQQPEPGALQKASIVLFVHVLSVMKIDLDSTRSEGIPSFSVSVDFDRSM